VISGASLGEPAGIALAPARGELFVANFGNDSITVYDMRADGSPAPLRTLSGALTKIHLPVGIALDLIHDEMFVSSSSQVSGFREILVFHLTDAGNVAPLRALGGLATLLHGARHVALDLAHDELVVALADGDAVNVYSRTASGNTAPTRRIAGPNTGLDFPFAVALGAAGTYLVTRWRRSSPSSGASGRGGASRWASAQPEIHAAASRGLNLYFVMPRLRAA